MRKSVKRGEKELTNVTETEKKDRGDKVSNLRIHFV